MLLPVNWISFTAQKAPNNTVKLMWSTASEVNNNHYEVQRSMNGVHFTTIGSVAASTNSGTNNYEYTDVLPLKGINYYRIKQVDNDGRFSYSSIQKINIDAVARLWKLYPNPATNSTGIYVSASIPQLNISLINLSGKAVYQTTVNNVTEGQRIEIPLKGLSKGVYILKVNTDTSSDTEKLIVE